MMIQERAVSVLGGVIDAIYEYRDKNKDRKKEKMLADLDALNQTITNGKRHEMKKTQATKDDITYRNICYFLGNGWNREELLREGRYTEEDFKVYDREKWKE